MLLPDAGGYEIEPCLMTPFWTLTCCVEVKYINLLIRESNNNNNWRMFWSIETSVSYLTICLSCKVGKYAKDNNCLCPAT